LQWVLVQGSSNTNFMVQSAQNPSLFLSYAGIGVAQHGSPGVQSQVVLRDQANAPVWTFTATGLTQFKSVVSLD
jgi:hypothetical protein